VQSTIKCEKGYFHRRSVNHIEQFMHCVFEFVAFYFNLCVDHSLAVGVYFLDQPRHHRSHGSDEEPDPSRRECRRA